MVTSKKLMRKLILTSELPTPPPHSLWCYARCRHIELRYFKPRVIRSQMLDFLNVSLASQREISPTVLYQM